uniref:RNase H type-1 domain-containing protein n=1 Tax=Hordeum vulgare subsp. vulgare TaxID=112509 RepID=A0A8I6XJ96_HORVV
MMQKRAPMEHRWKRPEPRFIKLNVDASFHADEGAGSVAGVLRDERGNFIAGFCKFIPLAADVVTIEAMAMRDGLFLANSLGFNRVESEPDSLSVISCCRGQDQWWDAVAAVFAECIDLSTSIGKAIFSHYFREAN